MINVFYIIIFISIFIVLFSYIFYPALVAILAQRKQPSGVVYSKDELPKIALVFAAYNEEKIIVQKMNNLNTIDYPTHLLDIYIGLDNPSDRTEELIQQNSDVKFKLSICNFKERGGKSEVLNKLFSKTIQLSDYECIIMSDANIISKENCVFELVKYFKNPKVGVVGAVIQNIYKSNSEVGVQEKFYIKNEGQLKVNEGLVFGTSVGAFGAFYAIRSKYIKSIPKNYLMEDFYLSMNALREGAFSLSNSSAIVYEDLPGTLNEEFKRKRRISTGNFQNLSAYFDIFFKNDFRVAFPFFAHKFLRWITPILLLIICVGVTFIFIKQPYILLHKILFILMLVNFLLPLLDIALQKLKINVNLLRLHRYFIAMNIALFLGFIDWLKGVETNIWKPTERL